MLSKSIQADPIIDPNSAPKWFQNGSKIVSIFAPPPNSIHTAHNLLSCG
ncbi:DEHA2D09680p [Debaryomyces hansenii CBS767]|uniref:DEHA2D09680p n=1 Tax=Debaryomyces hansenii (strain ATCC 36239 / CBS 767 / BCRC 21394 / JCM 1990 / NBRC 0083 / IGC 2968) TaxID=284592 RepID=B5RTG2_DEBHA|nr:DEHA2D09680p [Debaryomyces hansenii CBS767]CAR65647.1 DEHA2D09680p [Debaryomyces hansenii CBS767]|eukprot:XP_002770292.1 DEHA2D09680p [Debaryomyces hansenii CBS767]